MVDYDEDKTQRSLSQVPHHPVYNCFNGICI